MGGFLETEKQRLIGFKAGSGCFSERGAAGAGEYRGKPRPFCLPHECAGENLFAGVRQPALDHFARYAIKWHDGQDGRPSNRLCSSQVCCINFLFPFARESEALAALLRPLYPGLEAILPVEDGRYVTFEWIGRENYLGEVCPTGVRSRGAHFTSADAMVRFRRTDGLIHTVLIEWKYTESYSPEWKHEGPSGQTRLDIYRPFFDATDGPLGHPADCAYEALFTEPFYQFMRQQFLAREMERAREDGADVVSLLHIAPAHNRDFRRVTSPGLDRPGESATDVWARLIAPSGRFRSISTEALFGPLGELDRPELRDWWRYITARHPWLLEPAT